MKFEMDESEHTAEPGQRDPYGDTVDFVRYNYADIMQRGSDELKNAVNIVLGGRPPGVYRKGETA